MMAMTPSTLMSSEPEVAGVASGTVAVETPTSPVGKQLSSRTFQRAAVALACSKHVVPTHLKEPTDTK